MPMRRGSFKSPINSSLSLFRASIIFPAAFNALAADSCGGPSTPNKAMNPSPRNLSMRPSFFSTALPIALGANEECLLDKNLLKRDLGKILLILEKELENRVYGDKEDLPATAQISEDDQKEAVELLRAGNLLERTEEILNEIGIEGERSNKLVAFLAMTSRLLPKCLGVVIQNSSASGKSYFMDSILSLFPDSQKLVFSSLTGQALFYQKSLKHKILGISEDVGFERAGESLKLLQSQGYLSISTTSKDSKSGKMVSQDYHVEGPIALIFTTTSID